MPSSRKARSDQDLALHRFPRHELYLGAIEALDRARKPVLAFVEPFLDLRELGAWLSLRDLHATPGRKGNNIVNLGSFLLLMAQDGSGAVKTQVDTALQSRSSPGMTGSRSLRPASGASASCPIP